MTRTCGRVRRLHRINVDQEFHHFGVRFRRHIPVVSRPVGFYLGVYRRRSVACCVLQPTLMSLRCSTVTHDGWEPGRWDRKVPREDERRCSRIHLSREVQLLSEVLWPSADSFCDMPTASSEAVLDVLLQIFLQRDESDKTYKMMFHLRLFFSDSNEHEQKNKAWFIMTRSTSIATHLSSSEPDDINTEVPSRSG